MIYYYNSINDLLNLKVPSVHDIDESFKKIQVNIQEEMICRYRNILNVYSRQWKISSSYWWNTIYKTRTTYLSIMYS